MMAITNKTDDLGEIWMVEEHYQVLSSLMDNYDSSSKLLEIGTHKGRSAIHMLKSNDKITLTCLDTWPNKLIYEEFIANAKRYKVFDRVKIINDHSRNAHKYIQEVDFIYLDAWHIEEEVYADINYCMGKLLKKDGLLLGDDWQKPSVVKAVQRCIAEKKCVLLSHGDYTFQVKPDNLKP